MTFYIYNQNNSGGYFIEDENVSATVIIEAESEVLADIKLNEIISKKSKYTSYCSCCGKRWGGVDEIYESLECDSAVFDRLKKQQESSDVILYNADGTKRKIPWLRYEMYKYLD